jgi:acetyl esterase/lipase
MTKIDMKQEQYGETDGVDVTFEIWDCMWHVFQNTPIPESKDALTNMAIFFDEHLSK